MILKLPLFTHIETHFVTQQLRLAPEGAHPNSVFYGWCGESDSFCQACPRYKQHDIPSSDQKAVIIIVSSHVFSSRVLAAWNVGRPVWSTLICRVFLKSPALPYTQYSVCKRNSKCKVKRCQDIKHAWCDTQCTHFRTCFTFRIEWD